MSETHTTSEALHAGGSTVFFGCSSGGGASSSSPPPQPSSAAISSIPASIRNMGAACALLPALSILPIGEAAAQDTWGGADKKLHFYGSVVMAGVFTFATDRPLAAGAACLAVGVGKEYLHDAKPSKKDMVVDAAGCTLGAALAGVGLRRATGGPQLTYTWELK